MTTPDQLSADYTAQALRTESPITPALQTRLQQQARLVHAVLGLQTEAGELADPVKKHIYYGRPLDLVNLREEIGDCLWYLAIAADALGTTLEAEQARNLAKLRARYPHVFTAEAAQVRDLDREREVLEGDDLGTLGQQFQRAVSDAFSEVNSLRQQLAAAQQLTRDTRQQRDETVDKLNAANSQLVQLSALLHTANQHNLGLVAERDAARQTILAQKRGIQYLRLLIDKVRGILGRDDAMSERLEQISQALDEFDHGTIEPTPSPEVERLQEFVGKVRSILSPEDPYSNQLLGIEAALAKLDAGNSSATLTSSPAPVSEPAEKQWFRSHVQIDGCDGSTVNEKPYWESAWVWVSGQPADWRQLARRGDSQIPEWVWESLGLQMLCHAETRFNSQTNMMEFRNWEQRSPPTPVAEPLDAEGGS